MNILITGANTSQAYQLERVLKPFGDIFLGKDANFPEFMQSEKYIGIPGRSSVSYSHQLLSSCLDNGINYVYPVFKAEILALAESLFLFQEFDIEIIVPDLIKTRQLLNKSSRIAGEIVIRHRTKIIHGFAPDTLSLPETGIFTVNSSDYCLFTAD